MRFGTPRPTVRYKRVCGPCSLDVLVANTLSVSTTAVALGVFALLADRRPVVEVANQISRTGTPSETGGYTLRDGIFNLPDDNNDMMRALVLMADPNLLDINLGVY